MDSQKYLTPLNEAVTEIKRRNEDKELLNKIEAFLNNDVPVYFKQRPILYLARHIATPNFETLRFLDICAPIGLPTFIGQDSGDIFSPHNTLKKNLGKLHIEVGKSSNGVAYGRNATIIDFNSSNGHILKDIQTVWGENLVHFHNTLLLTFSRLQPSNLVDDRAWIDRHKRGDLIEHYKVYLSLFLVHGILFEAYEPQDEEFVHEILNPAFTFVEKQFGLKPLIVNLIPEGTETDVHWVSYQKEVFDFIQNVQRNKTNIFSNLIHKINNLLQR